MALLAFDFDVSHSVLSWLLDTREAVPDNQLLVRVLREAVSLSLPKRWLEVLV